jgi:hypothetical protein
MARNPILIVLKNPLPLFKLECGKISLLAADPLDTYSLVIATTPQPLGRHVICTWPPDAVTYIGTSGGRLSFNFFINRAQG